ESIAHSSRTALLICEAVVRNLGQEQCFRILEYVGEGRSVPPIFGESPEPTEGRDDKATYIFCAEIIAGNYDRVVEMVESGSGDVHVASKYFDQPIHLAALFGRTEIAAYLIQCNEVVSTVLANIQLSRYIRVMPYVIDQSDIRIRG